ncbi:HNH endonuclease [Deinococcus reticulitermitis]|uniref:HNH endonuclease n=2 Tax=Deinococcus reticulitermitis TaxID=856736 RepID=A0A1H7CAH4_9DEIO|nr:HNH endonuclease [Deinococcus reticulitermitis]
MERKWYALLVETESYAPGPQYLNWTTELRPELDERHISYALAPERGTRLAAQAYVDQHPHLVKLYLGSNRHHLIRGQGGRCWYCGRTLNTTRSGLEDSAELEHQTPRSRDLPESYASSNLVVSCRTCNNPAGDGKGDRTLEEYRAHLLQRRHPGKAHLFFYGEWLRFVTLAASGQLGRSALSRIAFNSFLHPQRALAFTPELLWAALKGEKQ